MTTNEQLRKLMRDKLLEFQKDGFEFMLFEIAGFHRYDEKKDVLTNNVFEPLPLSKMTSIYADDDGRLRFRLNGSDYTLVPVKTIFGRF